jgi:hypothetical protein
MKVVREVDAAMGCGASALDHLTPYILWNW